MRSKTIPEDAEVLRTYDELRDFRDAFFNGEFSFLLVVGRQGLGKSWEFKDRCRPRKGHGGAEYSFAHFAKGNITPVEAYRLAYEHRNKLLVFDDAERLWANGDGRYLLRDLTECTPWKVANWRTQNMELKRAGIPPSFSTSSRVCVILNRFAFGDAHEYAAIVDRAQFVYFDPTPLEIHRNTALWFWDQDIFDFIGEHLNLIDAEKLSSRTYVKAYERKPKGDWEQFLARRYFIQSGQQWVLALEADPKYTSVDERLAEFVRRTGLSRSSYFSLKKELKSSEQLDSLDVPRFRLTGEPPDGPDVEAELKAAAEEAERLEAERERERKRLEEEDREYREMEDRYFGDDGENDDDEE
jgi:hypothetical protein